MKKVYLSILSLLICCSIIFLGVACDSEHEHHYADNHTCHDRKCTECDYVLKATDSHTFEDEHTCHDRVCTVCGETVKATSEHVLPEHKSCEEAVCIVCGETVKSSVEHTFGRVKILKEATCTEDGYRGQVCEVCGAVKIVSIIEHSGHDFRDGICQNGCGVTEAEYNHTEHVFADSYDCHDRICQVCGKLVKATGSHLYLNDANCSDKTCCLCGETIKATSSHAFVSNYSCRDRLCSECGQYVQAATEHSPNNEGHCTCGYVLPSSGLTFTSVSGGSGYSVTGYNGEENEIIIPSTYKNKPVIAIADRAFKDSQLQGVFIPKTVKSIGYKAFYGAKQLKEISFGKYSALSDLGEGAFAECSSLTFALLPLNITNLPFEAFKNCSSLKQVELPEYLGKIGASAFYGCLSLQKLNIGKRVSELGENCFYNCKSLKSVSFKANSVLLNIHTNAFYECVMLSNFKLPESVQFIGENAFYNCNSLTELTLPVSLSQLSSSAFAECKKLLHVRNLSDCSFVAASSDCEVLSDKTTSFSTRVVYGSDGLSYLIKGSTKYILGYMGNETEIDLSDKTDVSAIYPYAFYNLALKKITLPKGLIEIGDSAFKNCLELNEVTFPTNCPLKKIGKEAFSGCEMLMSFTIPSYVENIEVHAFYACNRLVNVRNLSNISLNGLLSTEAMEILTDSTTEFSNIIASNNDIITLTTSSGKVYLLAYLGSADDLDLSGTGITNIYPYAFDSNQTLKSIVLPDTLEEIGECAFRYCTLLTQIELPESLEKINRYAFANCIVLSEVTFTGDCSLTEIADGAFELCSAITSLNLPASVKNIGLRAFYKCAKLQSITFAAGSQLETIGKEAFRDCTAITSICFPSSLKTIGEYAFNGNTKLTSISFGSGFDALIETIGDYAFNNCNELTTLDFGKYSHLSEIGEYAFSTCSKATKLVLPGNIQYIYLNAFMSCTGVTELYYGGDAESWELLHDDDLTNTEFYNDNSKVLPPNSTLYYYSETEPRKSGNYWHYVNGEITVWPNA